LAANITKVFVVITSYSHENMILATENITINVYDGENHVINDKIEEAYARGICFS
jgi:hypothetical protein